MAQDTNVLLESFAFAILHLLCVCHCFVFYVFATQLNVQPKVS